MIFHMQTILMYDPPVTLLRIYRKHVAFHFSLKSHLHKKLKMFLIVFLYQGKSLVRENFASYRVTLKCQMLHLFLLALQETWF